MWGSAVQLFYFRLKTDRQIIPDIEGQELIDTAAARRHAMSVARQLARHREADTRSWHIQVCDDYLMPLFEIPFEEDDGPVGGLRSHLRH